MKYGDIELTEDQFIEITAGLAAEIYLKDKYSNFSAADLDKQQLQEAVKASGGFDVAGSIARIGCEQTALVLNDLIIKRGFTLGLERIKQLLSSVYSCSFGQNAIIIDTSELGVDTSLQTTLAKDFNDTKPIIIANSEMETPETRVLLFVKDYGCPKSLLEVRNFVDRIRFSKRLTDSEIKAILWSVGCKIYDTPIIGDTPRPPLEVPIDENTDLLASTDTGTPPIIGDTPRPPLEVPIDENTDLLASTGTIVPKVIQTFNSFPSGTGQNRSYQNQPTSLDTAMNNQISAASTDTDANQKPKNSMLWGGIGIGLLTIGLLVGLYYLNKTGKKIKKG